MIVTVKTMKECENNSTLSTGELMEQVGFKIAYEIMNRHNTQEKIAIVCGKGNNGGDGYVVARLLLEKGYAVRVYPLFSTQSTNESQINRDRLKQYAFNEKIKEISDADVIIDAIFGFGFKGNIPLELKDIFQIMNQTHAIKYSIDMNSGSEADTGNFDVSSFISDITFALGYKKIIHQLRKDHFLFKECIVIPLEIQQCKASDVVEMDVEIFMSNFQMLKEDAHKGIEGIPLVIGGSYGMAGATILNILGTKASGCGYIQVACDDKIYSILATREVTPVFYPFTKDTVVSVLEHAMDKVKSISFGSGATYLDCKKKVLEFLLQQTTCPVVLDAEAIRMLKDNLYLLKLIKTSVILTPHLHEFSDLINVPIEVIKANKLKIAKSFAKEYKVILVLKGAQTIVVSNTGELYINQTGNAALAKAGSGDFLTGLITGFLSQNRDLFSAAICAVWLHGKAADLACRNHHPRYVEIESLLQYIDEFLYDINQ